MLYVPPALHRAIKQAGLDEGRSASAIYSEAARAWLELRGVSVETASEAAASDPSPSPVTLSDLIETIERQGRRIEVALATVEAPGRGRRESSQAPGGTKAAEAMQVVLRILNAAGAGGVAGPDLSSAAQKAGIRSGAAEQAKTVLRSAGVVRCENRRWYVGGPARTGET